jgi:hypothetical protein
MMATRSSYEPGSLVWQRSASHSSRMRASVFIHLNVEYQPEKVQNLDKRFLHALRTRIGCRVT